jgi:hypothetical protein
MHTHAIVSSLALLLASEGCLSSNDDEAAGPARFEAQAIAALNADSRAAIDISQGAKLPSRSVGDAATGDISSVTAGTTTEVFAIDNFLSVPISVFNSFTLQGTPSVSLPSSIPALSEQVFGVFVPSAVSWSQVISYTSNLGSPVGDAKACSWLLAVTFNTTCSATVSAAPLGLQGAICSFDPSRSFVDPATCQAQVVWTIQ